MTITEPNDNCWERGDGDTQQASWLHAESSTLTDLIGYMAFNQDYIYKYLKHILRRYRSEAWCGCHNTKQSYSRYGCTSMGMSCKAALWESNEPFSDMETPAGFSWRLDGRSKKREGGDNMQQEAAGWSRTRAAAVRTDPLHMEHMNISPTSISSEHQSWFLCFMMFVNVFLLDVHSTTQSAWIKAENINVFLDWSDISSPLQAIKQPQSLFYCFVKLIFFEGQTIITQGRLTVFFWSCHAGCQFSNSL